MVSSSDNKEQSIGASEQSEFWSRIADRYDRVVDLQIGRNTRSLLRERLRKEKQLGKVAEFGCGTGYYTQTLAQRADTVVATDLSSGMLDIARERTTAKNVRFQIEDCEHTSLPDAAFDSAFISLVLHFTEPENTLAEMHRLLKPGGTLIAGNLDLNALRGFDRLRCLTRIFYHGAIGYRLKPPKHFVRSMLTEKQIYELLNRSGFKVISSEAIRDPVRSSNIPMEYIKARKAQ